MGQLTLTDEEEQNQNFTDRNAESSQMHSDDSENPWKKQAGSGGSSGPTQQSTNAPSDTPKSNVYVPPSVIKGEVS